jgi:hypothetical protein
MILGTTAAVSITTAPPKECPTNLTGMLQELYVSYYIDDRFNKMCWITIMYSYRAFSH